MKKLKLTRSEIIITIAVVLFSGLIIVPSLLKCVVNKGRYRCEEHIYSMMHVLSDELTAELKSGDSYWHDLIGSGNLDCVIELANNRTGESDKFPTEDYYAKADGSSITIYCKKHPDMSEKTLRFSSIEDSEPPFDFDELFGFNAKK